MYYNYNYNICALVVILLSLWFLLFRKDMRRKNSQLFLMVLILEAIACVFDIWGAIMTNTPQVENVTLQTTVDGIYLLSHSLTACLVGWYFINFIGLRHKLHRPVVILYFAPVLLMVIPLLVPSLRMQMYYYTADGTYVRGPLLYWTIFLAGYLYSAITVGVAIYFRKRLNHEQMNAVLVLIVMSVVSLFIQQVFLPSQLINEFFEAVGIFLVLVSIDNQNWVYNFTTNTYNRLIFKRHLQTDYDNHTRFYVVALSISRSDYLNLLMLDSEMFERYMGQIANFLKGLKNRLNIYYCEPGAFAIPVYDDSHWTPDQLIQTISDRFRSPWVISDVEAYFKIRITKIRIPDEADTFVKLQKIVDLPYEDNAEEPLITDATTLLANLKPAKKADAEPDSDQTVLPEELALLLNDFSDHIEELTPAERSIVLYYIDGYEISDIPELAGISINTVRKHNKNIYRKLHIGSKEELMLYLDLLERCEMPDPIEKLQRGTREDETA